MAGFITQESIEAVKRAADIVSVVGEYVKLDKRGSDFWGCCPFHGEKTASFHVIPEKNAYYCFGCHAGGPSAIKFIQETEEEHGGWVNDVKEDRKQLLIKIENRLRNGN